MIWSSLLTDLRRIPQIVDLAIFFLMLHLRQRVLEPATVKTAPRSLNGYQHAGGNGAGHGRVGRAAR